MTKDLLLEDGLNLPLSSLNDEEGARSHPGSLFFHIFLSSALVTSRGLPLSLVEERGECQAVIPSYRTRCMIVPPRSYGITSAFDYYLLTPIGTLGYNLSPMRNSEISWLNLSEASDYIGVSVATLRSWVKRNEIDHYRIGVASDRSQGMIRFKQSDLDDYLAARQRKADVG